MYNRKGLVSQRLVEGVVDEAVKFGAKGIWNFAPTHVTVPDGVVLENVNLASSLAVLSHHLSVELSRKKKQK